MIFTDGKMSLDQLLGDPEKLSKMMQAIKNIELPSDGSEGETQDSGNDISADSIAEKLPEIMSVMKMLGGDGKPHEGKKENDKRICLLLALRPYMSPHRCEVIDYIIKMNNLGAIFKNLM